VRGSWIDDLVFFCWKFVGVGFFLQKLVDIVLLFVMFVGTCIGNL
jgi:hypothetical protein